MTRLVRDAYVTAQRTGDAPFKYWVQIPEDGLMLDIEIEATQIDAVTSDFELKTLDRPPGFERRDFTADVSLDSEQWRDYKRALESGENE